MKSLQGFQITGFRCFWIPGNSLVKGRMVVLAAVTAYNAKVVHALERDAISFQVVDRSTGDGVPGKYAVEWPGVARPMIEWEFDSCTENFPFREINQ